MQALHSEIQIDTPPQRVWQVLTDFDAYPQWNPSIRSIQGDVQVGSRFSVRVEPPGARGITRRPTVRALEPGRQLRWLGHLLMPDWPTASTGSRSSPSTAGAPGSFRVSASACCSSACWRRPWPRPSEASSR